jgi:hypothetical protein
VMVVPLFSAAWRKQPGTLIKPCKHAVTRPAGFRRTECTQCGAAFHYTPDTRP